MAADSHPQLLNSAGNNGLLKGFQVGSDKVNVSHLQFADDTLILMEGEEDKVPVLKSLIKCFKLVSSFKVNWPKSQLSTIGFSKSESLFMANSLRYSYKGWPAEYLASFLEVLLGIVFWDPEVVRCRKRLTRWKANYLSFGGGGGLVGRWVTLISKPHFLTFLPITFPFLNS